MFRLVFYFVLFLLLTRALSRLWAGVLEGMRGQGAGSPNVPQRGVQMARDPVCGTFVVPGRAVTLSVGHDLIYFCSPGCRDKYRAGAA